MPTPSATASSARRQRGVAVASALATVLTAAAVGSSTFALTRDPSPWPVNAASAMVPAHGHRELLATGSQNLQVLEVARLPGARALMPGPQSFINSGLSVEEQLAANWVRLSRVQTNEGSVSRSDVLLSVTDAGLLGHVTDDQRSFLAFRPGVIELPPQVRAGDTWTSTGTAYSGRDITFERQSSYRYEASAAAAAQPELQGKGCLTVTGTLTLGTTPFPSVTTWCPGRGIVAETGSQASSAAIDAYPAWADPRAQVTTSTRQATVSPTGAVLSTPDVATLPVTITPGGPPSFGSSGGAVAIRGSGDLVGFTLDQNAIQRRWRAAPGGLVTSLGAFGQVTVACTTARQLVAYDGDGRWLWTTDLPDVTREPLVQLDETTMVAAFMDGRVAAYDLRSGTLRWERQVDADLPVAPAVADGRVVVATSQGELSALDPRGEPLWSRTLPDRIDRLATAGGLVFASGNTSSRIYAWDAATGAPLWDWIERETRHQLLPFAGRLVVVADGSTYALDSAGREAWRRPMAGSAVTDGNTLFVVDAQSVGAFDADGRPVGSWPRPHYPDDPGRVWLAIDAAGRLVITDPSFRISLVGQP